MSGDNQDSGAVAQVGGVGGPVGGVGVPVGGAGVPVGGVGVGGTRGVRGQVVRRGSAPRPEPRGRAGRWLSRIAFFAVFFGLFWLLTRVPALFDAAGFNRVPVGGQVWINGQLADTVRLVFVPMERSYDQALQPIAVATTDKRGRFRLRDLQGKLGAARGRHLVFAVLPIPGVAEEASERAAESGTASGFGGRLLDGSEPEVLPDLPEFDAWQDASDLVGYWVQPNTLRGEVVVPVLGINDLELKWGRRSTHENP